MFLLAPTTTEAVKHRVIEAFNAADNTTYEIILCPYRTASFGIDLTGATHFYLFEPAVNVATEWQAIHRGVREGQKKAVQVTRLVTFNTFDKYRENNATKKIIPEMAMHHTNEMMGRLMRELVAESVGVEDVEDIDLEDSDTLRNATRKLVERLMGQDSSRDTDTPHISYNLLKRNAEAAGLA